jgi:antitoxin MazE
MESTIVSVKQKSQVTIPQSIMEKINLNIGDKLEIFVHDSQIVLKPVVMIPKEQSWFFSKVWQEKEKTVEENIQDEKISKVSTSQELLDELKKE